MPRRSFWRPRCESRAPGTALLRLSLREQMPTAVSPWSTGRNQHQAPSPRVFTERRPPPSLLLLSLSASSSTLVLIPSQPAWASASSLFSLLDHPCDPRLGPRCSTTTRVSLGALILQLPPTAPLQTLVSRLQSLSHPHTSTSRLVPRFRALNSQLCPVHSSRLSSTEQRLPPEGVANQKLLGFCRRFIIGKQKGRSLPSVIPMMVSNLVSEEPMYALVMI